MRAFAGLALLAFVVTACSEQEILRYQDRPAQNALECEAAYQAARQRGNSAYVNTSSGASIAGAALGRGLAKGMIESAYRNCLARVANGSALVTSPVATIEPTTNYRTAVEPQSSRPLACPVNASVLYGGTQYCTRN